MLHDAINFPTVAPTDALHSKPCTITTVHIRHSLPPHSRADVQAQRFAKGYVPDQYLMAFGGMCGGAAQGFTVTPTQRLKTIVMTAEGQPPATLIMTTLKRDGYLSLFRGVHLMATRRSIVRGHLPTPTTASLASDKQSMHLLPLRLFTGQKSLHFSPYTHIASSCGAVPPYLPRSTPYTLLQIKILMNLCLGNT